MADQDLTQDSQDTNTEAAAPEQDAEQAPAQDYTNEMISSPDMSQPNPSMVLENPKASVDQKAFALDALQQHQANIDNQKTSEAQQLITQKAKSFNAWQNANEKYDQVKGQAESLGKQAVMPARPDPAKFGLSMDDIASLSNPKTQQQIAPAVNDQMQSDQQQQQQTQAQQDALSGAQQAVKQQNTIAGYRAQQDQIDKHRQQLMDQSIKEVDDKQYQLDKIDPNRFWNSLSTGQGIMARIALALGGISGGLNHTGVNPAMQMLNQQIDRDIDAQKLSNENKIAMKANALKRVGLEIQKYSQMSSDNNQKMRMNLMVQNLDAQQQALKQQAAQQSAIKKQLYSSGLPQADFNVAVTDKELQKKAVVLPNGNVTIAGVEPTTEARKSLFDMNQGRTLLDQYQKAVNGMSLADKLNPLSDAHKSVDTIYETLTGMLRQPLTGTTRFTPDTDKKVRNMLGNPFLTTSDILNSRIDAVKGITNASIKNAYNQMGVKMPMSPEDKVRLELRNQGKDPSAVEAGLNAAKQKYPNLKWEE